MDDDAMWVTMEDLEIDEFLGNNQVGVIGFAAGGEAYTIPIAFGYDADKNRCVFQFIFDEWNKKSEFIDETETASLAVFKQGSDGTWLSVVIRGPLNQIPDDEIAAAASVFSASGEKAALDVFDKPLETSEARWYELDIEDRSGHAVF